MRVSQTNRRFRPVLALSVTVVAAGLVAAGCTNPGTSDTASSESENTQRARATEGPTCDIAAYGGQKISLKDAVVGFSQSEKEDNPFRITETKSITDEAKKVGVKRFIATNAQSQLSKQISDIQDLISQGANVLVVAPLNSDGLEPALKQAREKNIPVITVDRKLNATPCKDYVSFLGSDFVDQGKRAAQQLIKGTGGTGKVAILLGTSGNTVTADRTKGFVDEIKASAPGIEIVAQQTGEFSRGKGQTVAEQLLQQYPDLKAFYAENDEMGLGAQAAVVAAGKQPGTGIQIYSVDGTRNAVSQVAQNRYNGVVESNPRFGPLAFATLASFLDGKPVAQTVVIEDGEYDQANAQQRVGDSY